MEVLSNGEQFGEQYGEHAGRNQRDARSPKAARRAEALTSSPMVALAASYGTVARFGWARGPIWVGPWPPIWDDVSQDSCVPPCAYSHRGGSGTETDVTGASPRQDRSFRALLDRNMRDSTRSNAKYH